MKQQKRWVQGTGTEDLRRLVGDHGEDPLPGESYLGKKGGGWENHGKIMGKCGKILGIHGKIMGKCGKIMGNRWETDGKHMETDGKMWENHGEFRSFVASKI